MTNEANPIQVKASKPITKNDFARTISEISRVISLLLYIDILWLNLFNEKYELDMSWWWKMIAGVWLSTSNESETINVTIGQGAKFEKIIFTTNVFQLQS